MFAATMQDEMTITAQEKWASSDKNTREKMLASIGWPTCFAKESWKKLGHFIRENLNRKTWTK